MAGSVNYANGTFTGTLTGVSGSVTALFRWTQGNQNVNLLVPAMSGTSNGAAGTITGLPAEIIPVRAQGFLMRVRNNGAVGVGFGRVETSGIITLSPDLLFGLFSVLLGKGVEEQSVSWSMD